MHSRFAKAYAEYILRNTKPAHTLLFYPINRVTGQAFILIADSFSGPLTLVED